MEFRIDELLDGFEDQSVQIQTISYTSSDRIKELTMNKIKQDYMNTPRKRRSRRTFSVMIAAALVFALSIGAAAAYFTFLDRARQDMGISNPVEIKEWNEYETSDTQNVSLVSTFCSGEQLTAFLSVAPVTAEQAESLTWDEQYDECATWDIREVSPHGDGYSLLIEHVDYDVENSLALVKVSLYGSFLTDVEVVSAELFYSTRSDGRGVDTSYGEITIPTNSYNTLMCQPNLELNTDFTEDPVLIKNIAIGAGFVTVYAELPASLHVDNNIADDEVASKRAIEKVVVDWMENAELQFSDGSCISFSQMDGVFANWHTSLDDNCLSSTYWLSKPLNLTEIEVFVMDGVEYTLN